MEVGALEDKDIVERQKTKRALLPMDGSHDGGYAMAPTP